MYFACKCDELTIKQTEEIDKLGMIMEAHLEFLWYLKHRDTFMRKPHGTAHLVILLSVLVLFFTLTQIRLSHLIKIYYRCLERHK